MAEGWPVVFLGEQLTSLFDAIMASQKIIVVMVN